MQKPWWEGIASFLCGFWWLVLLIIVLILAVYFTRDQWLCPIFGVCNF